MLCETLIIGPSVSSPTPLSRTHLSLTDSLAAGHSLDTAVTTAQAGTCVLIGFGRGLVEGIRLAPDADARVAGAEEVCALLADGEVVGGLVGAGLGKAGCGGGGQDEEGCQLHVDGWVYDLWRWCWWWLELSRDVSMLKMCSGCLEIVMM